MADALSKAKAHYNACSELYWENFLYGKENSDERSLGRADAYSDAVYRLRQVIFEIEFERSLAALNAEPTSTDQLGGG